MKLQNQNQQTVININELEMFSPSQRTSVVVSAGAYAGCLAEFEAMAGSDGARFGCELGPCDLAFNLHADSANIILLRHSREDVGKARLVWSEPALNGVRGTSFLKGYPLTEKNIPCLIVDLADSFRASATAKDTHLAIHALAAAAFGLLRHMAKAPAVNSYQAAITLPSTNISSKLLGKKQSNDMEL